MHRENKFFYFNLCYLLKESFKENKASSEYIYIYIFDSLS